jgi:hypothetical protein
LALRATSGKAINNILDAMTFASFVTPEQFPPVIKSTAPLAIAILALLAGHDALRTTVDPRPPHAVTYYTPDTSSVRANALALTLDDKTISLLEDPTTKGSPRKDATLTTDKLIFPDSTISLYEVLRWTRGELKVGNGIVSAQSLNHQWAQLNDPAFIPPAADLSTMNDLKTHMDDLTKVLLRAFRAAQAQAGAGTADVVYASLGAWLITRVLPCNPQSLTYAPDLKLSELCAAGTGWPGYSAANNGGPVGELANRLADLVGAQKTIGDNPLAIKKTSEQITAVAKLPYQIEYTQKSWVFTYVTPVVGYATIGKDGGTIGYTGVQIHWFPNEVDKPQWANGGSDVGRAFALELGAGFGGSFGPNDRYDGPGKLPVLFAGLALHLIPYTSITGGVAIFDSRASALPGENVHLTAAPYFGLNVQVNVPGLIGGMFSSTTTTKTN